MDTIKEKRCSICHDIKLLSEFGKNKCLPYGVRCECLECRRSGRKRQIEILPVGTKRCFKCKVIKEKNEFRSDCQKKDGISTYCNVCNSERSKEKYIKKHGVKIKETLPIGLKRCAKCKEIKKVDNYYKSSHNKDGRKRYCKECTKISFDKNKRRIYIKKWTNDYNRKNPHKVAWRNILKHTLNKFKLDKTAPTIKLLGYSAKELREYIESLFTNGMTWDNYGDWHIDHIKPMSVFAIDTPICIVNALSNLQPLWATTRIIDGILYIGNINKSNKLL